MSTELELPAFRRIFDIRRMNDSRFSGILSQEDCPYCSNKARCPTHEAMFQHPVRSHTTQDMGWKPSKKRGKPRRKFLDYEDDGFVVDDNQNNESIKNDDEDEEAIQSNNGDDSAAIEEEYERQEKLKQDRKREKELTNALTHMTIRTKKERLARRKKESVLSNDPERLRKRQEYLERMESKKARKKARSERQSQARDQEASTKAQTRAQRKAEANVALEQVRAEEQRLAGERRAEKTRIGSLKSDQSDQQEDQDTDCLVAVNGQRFDQADFLSRAYDLMKEAYGESMSKKAKSNLEEALTLVHTSILLGSGLPTNGLVGQDMYHNNKEETGQQTDQYDMIQHNNESNAMQEDAMEEDL